MITCKLCRKQVDPKLWGKTTAENIAIKMLCFSCLFWKSKTTIRDRPNVVRIDGDHFIIGPESDKYKGFGGDEFTIKFFDSRVITTTNLWYQGKIPEHFRKALEDNAEFINEP